MIYLWTYSRTHTPTSRSRRFALFEFPKCINNNNVHCAWCMNEMELKNFATLHTVWHKIYPVVRSYHIISNPLAQMEFSLYLTIAWIFVSAQKFANCAPVKIKNIVFKILYHIGSSFIFFVHDWCHQSWRTVWQNWANSSQMSQMSATEVKNYLGSAQMLSWIPRRKYLWRPNRHLSNFLSQITIFEAILNIARREV